MTITWKNLLADEKQKPYFKEILAMVEKDRAQGIKVYPKNSEIFNSLALCSWENLKVVIIGQDPYHGPGQAHGLSFSVKPGIPFPPSLQNIFKELKADLNIPTPTNGCLDRWANQGVLLLNAVLTVREGQPNSHADRGWEKFTDAVINVINQNKSGIVFMLWGSYAQKKGAAINPEKHCVLTAPHPSPLSAHRGFLGCQHFSKCNLYFKNNGQTPISW